MANEQDALAIGVRAANARAEAAAKCALDDANLRLRLLEEHLDNHGFPIDGPMRSIARGDSIPLEAE